MPGSRANTILACHHETTSSAVGRAIKILVFYPIVPSLSIYMCLVYSYFYLLLLLPPLTSISSYFYLLLLLPPLTSTSSYFYLLFTTFTPVFEDNYHFASSVTGLSYVGVGIGFDWTDDLREVGG